VPGRRSKDLEMSETLHHLVNGHRVSGESDRFSEVYDPALGAVTKRCPLATAAEVDRAVEVASEAGRKWGRSSQKARREVIFRMRELISRDARSLAETVSLEHGKNQRDAMGEVGRALETMEYAACAGELTKGEFSVNIGGDIDNFSIRLPLGVVGCIVPFNFPLLVPLLTSAMAVACGNAVIMKPSEKTPSAALRLAELWQEAGLPDGVWNVVNGDKEAVDAILNHPDIAAISFVGSSAVGDHVYDLASRNKKRVACFNAGKNHMVVMPDADLDFVADSFISGAYGDASQRCMAVSVLVPVEEQTGDRLVEMISKKASRLTPGHYADPNATFGPVISAQSKASIESAIEAGLSHGGELRNDGRGYQVSGFENGFFLGATLMDHVRTDSPYYQEEVFGPARAVVRAGSLAESIEMINAHQYGNGAAIFTRDGGAAREFYENVETGGVGINVPIPACSASHNFGGLKNSRYGEAFLYGPDSARFFTKEKTVSSRWNSADNSDVFVTMYNGKGSQP
jgi:malonate-semialdehyde dehydrogenase (acetylating)/methylmalonate-semialdehyde dehydrogenase